MTKSGATIKREPMTCLGCWERYGTNVPLRLRETTYDNRSVEARSLYECPECWREVRVNL